VPESAYFLIVGVNNGGRQRPPLAAARRDAEAVSRSLVDMGYPRAANHRLLVDGEVTHKTITAELESLGRKNDHDLLLVYWAGHAIKTEHEISLYLGDTRDENKYLSQMIQIQQLVAAWTRAKGPQGLVLILDTCYSGAAVDLAAAVQTRRNYCVLAACGATEEAREDPIRHGFMTAALLDELNAAQGRNDASLDFGAIFRNVKERLANEKRRAGIEQEVDLAQRGASVTLPFRQRLATREAPAASGRTDRRTGQRLSTDPLEEALGYLIQAFRSYLNDNVVRGVEVIYFLGYDVWDGCLVYDGLVQGDIEQRLLNFIRSRFLHRDRLRSKYEDLLATPQHAEELGMAGRCFRTAVETMQKGGSENPTLRGLLYIRDLRRYRSEYKYFDRLLGLRSCLYIPLVETMFPSAAADPAEAQARRALGGVLMAGNRRPSGLVPVPLGITDEEWRQRGEDTLHIAPGTDLTRLDPQDRATSEGLRQYLTATETDPASGSEREIFRHQEMRSFLGSIGGVYQQRAARRGGLRKGLHPRFLKTAKREIDRNGGGRGEREGTLIESVSEKVGLQRGADAIKFAERVRRLGVAYFLPEKIEATQPAEQLAKDYVLATAWRDLELDLRLLKARKSHRSKQEEELAESRAEEVRLNALQAELDRSWRAGEATWRRYVEQEQVFDRVSDRRTLPELGDSTLWRLSIGLIDDLLDDLREARRTPFEIASAAVKELAPVGRYIEAVAQLEGAFGGITQQKMFNDLAHSLQIWVLGLWILSTPIPRAPAERGEEREDETVRHRFARYIAGQKALQQLVPRQPEQNEDLVVLSWGLIAAMHDIAIPVQRFEKNFRWFFNQYFGQESLPDREGSLVSVMMDVLDHPRFPIYKNAITSLYKSHPRDWVEAIFHHALAKNVLHSTVGALILIRELEPEPESEASGGTPRAAALWQAIRPFLDTIGQKHQDDDPELGLLIPAYLAHAVTFSQLPDFVALWQKLTDSWGTERRLQYLRKTADGFRVSLEQYPLSYILALLEVLLEPSYDDELAAHPGNGADRGRKGQSPFYLSHVDLIAGGPERGAAATLESRLVLRLTVKFWGDSLIDEEEIFTSGYIKGTYEDFREKQKLRKTKPPAGAARSEELLKMTPRVADIMRLLDRLEAFDRCFDSTEWKVRIILGNVPMGHEGEFFTYPDNLP
jgi:hypothetical protein